MTSGTLRSSSSRGEKAWVVNVSSIGGLLPSPLMAPYSVTKFGALALTESLHHEMLMKGAPVQVSVVTPGTVKSEIFRAARPGETLPPEAAAFNARLQTLADKHGLTPPGARRASLRAGRRGKVLGNPAARATLPLPPATHRHDPAPGNPPAARDLIPSGNAGRPLPTSTAAASRTPLQHSADGVRTPPAGPDLQRVAPGRDTEAFCTVSAHRILPRPDTPSLERPARRERSTLRYTPTRPQPALFEP
ncbi:SDR family NAD(P)-dependent oxidoreductase [Streptomyces griseus]|uniref:SDR family NAD(P)-dependent oxidoreductase n=1 Tax=Streptomyces griseus TaxID=1911 RepID=UPI0037A375C0